MIQNIYMIHVISFFEIPFMRYIIIYALLFFLLLFLGIWGGDGSEDGSNLQVE